MQHDKVAPPAVSEGSTRCIASTYVPIGMKHHEGDDNELGTTAGQPPVDESKALEDRNIALKWKVQDSKKIYIHNYFTSGVGEEKEGEPATPMDDPTPQAVAILPSLILEPDTGA
ncbi:hypothetical protein NDU88_005194 [Pleurodeles waltl]|uniref:Uncharacterized protein n=1 Tax=Pleurodeles waltl TaxID=8319 RepID=A0AAV7MBE3_PLEWA|nr:hypothetical protein NDU88_005194 [Pleurodeles waltl]